MAAFWNRKSASAAILDACSEGRVRLYYAPQIRREIFEVLRDIRASDQFKGRVNEILARGTEISLAGDVSLADGDPEDDKFLECALVAEVRYLVTNDEHLLQFDGYGGVTVLRPGRFKAIIG